MSWPIATDYQEAIQNPQLCFANGDLKSGKAKENHLGPIPIAGAFAVVYQVTTPTGRWAVRCFLTQVGDHRKRYAAISSHLQSSQLKYAVRFEYLEQGIKIKGQWYPILKMEWIDGDPLNSFVSKNVNNPAKLLELTREWVEMMKGLKASQIAHGDLQHGNILVTPAGLRLIDYDGMYVPALAGLTSPEEGHRNYQHPSRTGRDFGTYVDNFAAWVVFCSITAVALDSRLWQMVDGGDECLLFRRDDFRHPERSRVFDILRRSRPEVRAIADHFKSLVMLPIQQVPALDGRIVKQAKTSDELGSTREMPDWLSDQLRSAPNAVPPKADVTKSDVGSETVAGASWIIEHLVDQQSPPITLRSHSFVFERVAVVTVAIVVLSLTFASTQSILSPVLPIVCAVVAAGLVVTLFIIRFGQATHVKDRRIIAEKLRDINSHMKTANSEIKEVTSRRNSDITPLLTLKSELKKLQDITSRELAVVRQRTDSFRIAFAGERQKLASDEIQSLRAAELDVRHQSAALQAELNNLGRLEQNELTQAMDAHRNDHINSVLRNTRIRNASLYRIGNVLKDRLEERGIRTAADVDYHRVANVEGFGPTFSSVVHEWRKKIEHNAQQSVPPFPVSAVTTIRNRFASRKSGLENQISSFRDREHRMRNAVLEKFQQARLAYDDQERNNLESFANDERLVRAKYQKEFQRIDNEYRTHELRLAPVRKQHDSRLAELNRQITQQRFEVCRLEREIGRYKRLTWGRYLARTFGLVRAA